MNKNVNNIYAYLFDGDSTLEDKILVCTKICGIWKGTEPFHIIPNILKMLKETGEVPSYEHYVEYYSFLESYEKPDQVLPLSEIINLIDKEHTNSLTKEVSSQITEALSSGKDTDEASDIISKLSSILSKYNSSSDSDQELLPIEELYQRRKGLSKGILTGIEPVDLLVYSLEMGTISVIAAASGGGKTTAAKSISYNNIVNLSYNVLFVSLEMPREVIIYDLLARHSAHDKFKGIGEPILSTAMRNTELTEEQEDFLFNVVKKDLYENPDYGKFEVVGSTFFRFFTDYGMRSAISKLPFKPDFIIFDYIQLLQYVAHPPELYKLKLGEPTNYYIQQIKNLSEDLDGSGKMCHCMLLSQLNKEGEKFLNANEGKAPLTALAQFHELSRTPSYVLFLWNTDVLKDNNECTVFLAKNRMGPTMIDPALVHINPAFNIIGSEVKSNPSEFSFGEILD